MKDEVIRLRVSGGVRAAIEHAAARDGVNVSRFVRRSALNVAARRPVLSAEEHADLVELVHQVYKSGVNLNQIAYDLNHSAAHPTPGATIEQIGAALDAHNAILARVQPFIEDLEARADTLAAGLCKPHPLES